MKKRLAGNDLMVISLLGQAFWRLSREGQGLSHLRMEDVTGLTISTSYFMTAGTASVVFTIKGKLSWLNLGGFRVDGIIERRPYENFWRPFGEWKFVIGTSSYTIVYPKEVVE